MRSPAFQSSVGGPLVLHGETWRGSWAWVSATIVGSAEIRLHPPPGGSEGAPTHHLWFPWGSPSSTLFFQ